MSVHGRRAITKQLVSIALCALAACAGEGDAGEEEVALSEQALVAVEGPTYLGSKDKGDTCGTTYKTTGYAPASGAPGPVFLYFVGTDFFGRRDEYAATDPREVLKKMAERGFYALSVQYDNTPAAIFGLDSHNATPFKCIFDRYRANSLIQKVCAQTSLASCDKGIVTWGHSLGGAVALAAKNFEPRVRAAWATGVGSVSYRSVTPTLSRKKMRIVNGANDNGNNDNNALNSALGLTWYVDCPSQWNSCLRADGSGWILVQRSELTPQRDAGHCWFDQNGCDKYATPDVGWSAAPAPSPYNPQNRSLSIAANADWLVRASQTP